MWTDQTRITFPHKQTVTHAHPHARTHTTNWLDRCIFLYESCVWWVASRGVGQCAACLLSIRLSLYSHIFSSADGSSLLLLHWMRESPSNLGIREAFINLIHLNLKRGGFFFPPAAFHAVQIHCLWSSLPVHYKQRCTVEEKGLQSLDKVK